MACAIYEKSLVLMVGLEHMHHFCCYYDNI